jgi:hypothetical protein
MLEKVQKGQARLVRWGDIKNNLPKDLKISPITMILHKSWGFRAILNLSYNIRLCGHTVTLVNESTINTAPHGAIDQMGHALSRIIHAFAEADDDSTIFLTKWDIKDGFWRLNCEEGQEWNFMYVLPPDQPSTEVELVVPTSCQMGWIESPPHFRAASETTCNAIGSLPDNKFITWATDSYDFCTLPPRAGTNAGLKYMVEVYMNDYIGLAILASQEHLCHTAKAVMHGIHNVFPANQHNAEDPISFKKLQK